MKSNIYDSVLEKTLARVEKATDSIAKNFKNVKPFDKEAVSNKEMLFWYNDLSRDDMIYLLKRHGGEKLNDFIYEMEQIKEKVK